MITQLEMQNLIVLGDRLHWPVGAVGAVAELRADFPAWTATWSWGGLPRWREPGYYAWPVDHRLTRRVLYRADAAQVREVLEHAPDPGRGWAPPGGWLAL